MDLLLGTFLDLSAGRMSHFLVRLHVSPCSSFSCLFVLPFRVFDSSFLAFSFLDPFSRVSLQQVFLIIHLGPIFVVSTARWIKTNKKASSPIVGTAGLITTVCICPCVQHPSYRP